MKHKQLSTKGKGIQHKAEVATNPDKHIDQDFPGFPHAPSSKSTIQPQTKEDEVNANLKKNDKDTKHVGSANAFEATENDEVLRGELDDDHETDDKESQY